VQGFDLNTLLLALVPLLFAITVHETAHGWVAKQLGDPTAFMLGRLTLNPIKHIDPLGTIIVPILLYTVAGFPFGWAKPVPVAFGNLRKPRRDMILVAAAGPGSNLLMAAIWALVPTLLYPLTFVSEGIQANLMRVGELGIMFNVILAVFNMVPIPPLDGGRVLHGLLPPRQSAILDKIEPFGILIVVGLVYLGPLWTMLQPVMIFFQRIFFGLQHVFIQIWGI